MEKYKALMAEEGQHYRHFETKQQEEKKAKDFKTMPTGVTRTQHDSDEDLSSDGLRTDDSLSEFTGKRKKGKGGEKKETAIEPKRALTPSSDHHKKPTRLIKRTVFYQGAAFMIEEEVSIASSEESSVKTSEDDFQVDD